MLSPLALSNGRRAARDRDGTVSAGETTSTCTPPEKEGGSCTTEATQEAERTSWRGIAPRAEDWLPELAEQIKEPHTGEETGAEGKGADATPAPTARVQDYEASSTFPTASAAARPQDYVAWNTFTAASCPCEGDADLEVTTYASATSNDGEKHAGYEVTTLAARTPAGVEEEQRNLVEPRTELTAKDVRAGDYPDQEDEARYDDRRGNEVEVA